MALINKLFIVFSVAVIMVACSPIEPQLTSGFTPTIVAPTVVLTSTVESTRTPTAKPNEYHIELVRPSSNDTYPDSVWMAIESGFFENQEKGWQSIIDYYENAKESDRPLFAQEPGSETSTLIFKYILDIDNPDNTQNIIVALESSDYPNTAILPPIDFEKSDGLSVYFKESLPYEKSGHEVPSHLMPTFLTIDANEESVSTGKMQERFLGTTLVNKGGELVRIDSEGKVIAKIGVKQKTKEARWVRPMMEYSGPDWEKYPLVTLDEIYNGQILYDYEVQTAFTPGERKFPTSWRKRSSDYGCTYWTDPLSEALDYMYDKYPITTRLDNGKLFIMEVQQVNMGDEQHFLHYTNGVVGTPYLGVEFDKSQESMPGSYSPPGTISYFGISPSDLKKDSQFYAKGGELEKIMDDWLIVNKGQVAKGDIDRVIMIASGATPRN